MAPGQIISETAKTATPEIIATAVTSQPVTSEAVSKFIKSTVEAATSEELVSIIETATKATTPEILSTVLEKTVEFSTREELTEIKINLRS